MDKINVLIIEDTPEEADQLQLALKKNNYTVAAIANNLQSALTLYYQLDIDIVIVDVFLDGAPDGVVFVETISNKPGRLKPFVFLTSSNDRQIFERAKLTKPFSFLIKPFNELELLYTIELALEKFYDQKNVFSDELQNTIISNEYLFIKKKNVLNKVLLTDIIYIEVEDRYCNIMTKKEMFVIQIALEKMKRLLDNDIFIQTHRKYLINSNEIEQINTGDNLILLTGKHKVTIGDKYKDILKKFTVLK